MRIENASRVLVLPFTITQKPQVPLQVQHFSLGLLSCIQDFTLKRMEYSIFKKRFSIFPFQNLLLWIFWWRISTFLKMISLLLELSRNCGMSNMNLYVHICKWASFLVWNFALLQNSKKIVAKSIFLKEKNLNDISTISIKIENFLIIVQASSEKYMKILKKFLCIFVMSQI